MADHVQCDHLDTRKKKDEEAAFRGILVDTSFWLVHCRRVSPKMLGEHPPEPHFPMAEAGRNAPRDRAAVRSQVFIPENCKGWVTGNRGSELRRMEMETGTSLRRE